MSKRDVAMFLAGILCGGAIIAGVFLALSPALPISSTAVRPGPSSTAAASPQLAPRGFHYALDGYCPVTVVDKEQWTPGNVEYREEHGKLIFLFAGPSEQQLFRQNPDRYVPVFSGNDIVLATETGTTASGKRKHGVVYADRIYLFAAEDSLQRFMQEPASYVGRIQKESSQSEGERVANGKR